MRWICPLCHTPLQSNSEHKNIRCDNNHCFDVAKEGYVNLMPVNQKKSKNPGDSKAMIQARKQFLAAGFYSNLAEALADKVKQYCAASDAQLLEVGCGEGYYLREIANRLDTTALDIHGLDISKHAIKAAAKQNRAQCYSVASSFHMPVMDACMDMVIRNFAPAPSTEIQRVLKDDGIFIVVTPGPRHLYQLRQQIYRQATEHDNNLTGIEGFDLIEQQSLTNTLHIDDPEQLTSLLQMTPYYWQTSDADKQKLDQLQQLECETDFVISVLKASPKPDE